MCWKYFFQNLLCAISQPKMFGFCSKVVQRTSMVTLCPKSTSCRKFRAWALSPWFRGFWCTASCLHRLISNVTQWTVDQCCIWIPLWLIMLCNDYDCQLRRPHSTIVNSTWSSSQGSHTVFGRRSNCMHFDNCNDVTMIIWCVTLLQVLAPTLGTPKLSRLLNVWKFDIPNIHKYDKQQGLTKSHIGFLHNIEITSSCSLLLRVSVIGEIDKMDVPESPGVSHPNTIGLNATHPRLQLCPPSGTLLVSGRCDFSRWGVLYLPIHRLLQLYSNNLLPFGGNSRAFSELVNLAHPDSQM
jgi:hypothetical protein